MAIVLMKSKGVNYLNPMFYGVIYLRKAAMKKSVEMIQRTISAKLVVTHHSCPATSVFDKVTGALTLTTLGSYINSL